MKYRVLLFLMAIPAFHPHTYAVLMSTRLTLDMLIDDLASGDDGARQVRARQMLPLTGASGAEKVIGLLEDSRPSVAFVALRVLEDIIHEANKQGNATEADQVAAVIISLLHDDTSPKLKRIGLRLLPFAATEQTPLTPLVQLLKKPKLCEETRVCLEEIGTEPARTILCEALAEAPPSFKIHLLRSIKVMGPGNNVGLIQPLLEDESPAVRAAALQALSSTGNPALVSYARQICASADIETAFDAWDGWLRLTDAMAVRGGFWHQVIELYREILEKSPLTIIQSAAIIGMGKFGDDSCVPIITNAVAREGGEVLEPAALEAFRSMAGRDVRKALLAIFPEARPTLKLGLISLFGEGMAPEYITLIVEKTQDEDPLVRSAALRVLRENPIPESVVIFGSLLETAAQEAEHWNKERSMVSEALIEIAHKLDRVGNSEEAGRAWLSIYKQSQSEEQRAMALEGIRKHPTPEAFEIVLDLLKKDDVTQLSPALLIAVAQKALVSGREVEGKELLSLVLSRITTPQSIREVIEALRAYGSNQEAARLMGFITRWYFVGPFPWNPLEGFKPSFIDEPTIDLNAIYTVENRNIQWHPHETLDIGGVFDLITLIAPTENAVAFAYSEIEVAEGGKAQIRTGSDDGIRVWVNGEQVLEKDVDRGADIDQDIADIVLNSGTNKILVQITQRSGGWGFVLRLTDPNGKPYAYQLK